VIGDALAQLTGGHTRGKRVLVRIDGAGGTHELLAWLTRRRLSYSERVEKGGLTGCP
jgi:hypothetical protein